MKNQAELLSSLLDMAEAMLMVGAEVSRVEDTVTRMGFAYGARHMNVFVITSCIMITMGMPEGEERYVWNVRYMRIGCLLRLWIRAAELQILRRRWNLSIHQSPN